MKEEISKIVSRSGLKEVKKNDFNRMKEWKEDEYRKICSDLELISKQFAFFFKILAIK